MPVIPTVWRLRQENHEFEHSLGYRASQSQQINNIKFLNAVFVLFCFIETEWYVSQSRFKFTMQDDLELLILQLLLPM